MRASYPPRAAEGPARRDGARGATRPTAPTCSRCSRARRGWIARLERDMSGVAQRRGRRANARPSSLRRGTRYPFRRRDNGIWGLTIFTAELAAEAERAARDLEVVERAADDYDARARRRARPPPLASTAFFSCRPTSGRRACPSSTGSPARDQPGSVT